MVEHCGRGWGRCNPFEIGKDADYGWGMSREYVLLPFRAPILLLTSTSQSLGIPHPPNRALPNIRGPMLPQDIRNPWPSLVMASDPASRLSGLRDGLGSGLHTSPPRR